MTELDPRLTFEAFVVGPANRLASAAARRAADAPGTAYNPLFLYGASGLGKSHILHAMAHQARKRSEDRGVTYRTMEEFLEELEEALATGEREGLRERYRGLDMLLLDDVQFLAGQPEAQEMLLRTLDVLTTAGRQVVLASDRRPAEIDGLDTRLLSRFAGGLIVDVAPPDYETRVAIVRRKAEDRGQTLQRGVAEALARHPFRNVRELGGGLNRVLAIQELEARPVELDEVKRLLRDGAPEGSGDALDDLLAEITGVLDTRSEEPWRKAVREARDEAETEGFQVRRLQAMLDERHAPRAWQEKLDAFRADLRRLREIADELDRLDNPWPEAASAVVHDPDRLEEAEALLASVRERVRPFARVQAGPSPDALAEHYPTLPVRAVQQVTSAEKPRYVPLFLWSSPVAGARALVGAAARAFAATHPGGRIAVMSVEEFAEDFIRALSNGVAGAWRERWWTLDALMIHGLEKLPETERAQEEFFHLFEALKRRGSRMVLAADRPPARIDDIDERLRSRFEGGLVLEAPARKLAEGTDTIAFETEDQPAQEWHGIPLDDEAVAGVAEEGAPVAAPPGTAAAVTGGGRPWSPSGERVVWRWPQVEDRLVEDFD